MISTSYSLAGASGVSCVQRSSTELAASIEVTRALVAEPLTGWMRMREMSTFSLGSVITLECQENGTGDQRWHIGATCRDSRVRTATFFRGAAACQPASRLTDFARGCSARTTAEAQFLTLLARRGIAETASFRFPPA